MAKWNPMGGAIAFGHPNGASGARVAMFAMRELIRRGGGLGHLVGAVREPPLPRTAPTAYAS